MAESNLKSLHYLFQAIQVFLSAPSEPLNTVDILRGELCESNERLIVFPNIVQRAQVVGQLCNLSNTEMQELVGDVLLDLNATTLLEQVSLVKLGITQYKHPLTPEIGLDFNVCGRMSLSENTTVHDSRRHLILCSDVYVPKN